MSARRQLLAQLGSRARGRPASGRQTPRRPATSRARRTSRTVRHDVHGAARACTLSTIRTAQDQIRADKGHRPGASARRSPRSYGPRERIANRADVATRAPIHYERPNGLAPRTPLRSLRLLGPRRRRRHRPGSHRLLLASLIQQDTCHYRRQRIRVVTMRQAGKVTIWGTPSDELRGDQQDQPLASYDYGQRVPDRVNRHRDARPRPPCGGPVLVTSPRARALDSTLRTVAAEPPTSAASSVTVAPCGWEPRASASRSVRVLIDGGAPPSLSRRPSRSSLRPARISPRAIATSSCSSRSSSVAVAPLAPR